MGFFNNLKDRFSRDRDEYYDDDGYEDQYYDENGEPEPKRSGILGNPRRPEAASVSVYTRSGKPVGTNATQGHPSETVGYKPASEVSHYSGSRGTGGYRNSSSSSYSSQDNYRFRNGQFEGSGRITPGDIGGRPIPRASGTQLPPYVIMPASYDDVQMVVRRVGTKQPVVLVFRNTNIEEAKRILDFCFGYSMGVGGQVQELGERVFAVLPAGVELSDADINKLIADGDLER